MRAPAWGSGRLLESWGDPGDDMGGGETGNLQEAWVQMAGAMATVDKRPELFGSRRLLDCGSWVISPPLSLGYLGPGFPESHETKEFQAGHSALDKL